MKINHFFLNSFVLTKQHSDFFVYNFFIYIPIFPHLCSKHHNWINTFFEDLFIAFLTLGRERTTSRKSNSGQAEAPTG